MLTSTILLILSGGIPYFIFLEKSKKVSSKYTFIISAVLLLGAIILSLYIPNNHEMSLVVISLVSALFAMYKATKTTNFYKLGYYLIFVNAPFFVLFEEKGALYSLSLLVSLLGIYLTARFYEKNYGSANYHYIRGITLSTPYIGIFLTVFLIAIALYPPFPNSLFFLSYILQSETNLFSYAVVIVLFFGNFLLAMGVMKESLFGKPNSNIHYVDLNFKEKASHFIVVLLLLILSIYGLKETLI
jgi:hypothetical protein